MSLKDKQCRDAILRDVNLVVPWYIGACYAYEVLDDPFLSDECFDGLGYRLRDHWDQIEHRHKKFIKMPKDRSTWKPSAITIPKLRSLPSIIHYATLALLEGVRESE